MDNKHWAYDAELLERYVLERLEPGQREELERHLTTCEYCRIAVREEREIVAGVRRLAREEFKAKLKHRLQTEQASLVPWIRLATAAAVIVTLVGVGIYNDWFTWYSEKNITEEYQEEKPATGDIPKRPPSEMNDEIGEKPASTGAMKQQEREPLEQKTRKKEGPIVQQPSVSLESASGAGEGVRRDYAGAEAKELDTALEKKQEKPLWVQGKILTTTIEGIKLQSEAPAAADRMTDPKTSRNELRITPESGTIERQRITLQQGMQSQVVILSQRTKSHLSPEHQAITHEVPTLIEQTEQGLQFTLYLDKPVSDDDLRNATIEPIHSDSLILHLGNQRIGYHIPGGWGSKLPAKQ